MRRALSDQERLEIETNRRMTPRERLDWLGAAWEFATMPKRQVRKEK